MGGQAKALLGEGWCCQLLQMTWRCSFCLINTHWIAESFPLLPHLFGWRTGRQEKNTPSQNVFCTSCLFRNNPPSDWHEYSPECTGHRGQSLSMPCTLILQNVFQASYQGKLLYRNWAFWWWYWIAERRKVEWRRQIWTHHSHLSKGLLQWASPCPLTQAQCEASLEYRTLWIKLFPLFIWLILPH